MQYEMDVQTHTCAIDEAGNRAVYFFDGFMNHSCSPNTYSLSIDDTPTGGSYYQTALRDIEPGMPNNKRNVSSKTAGFLACRIGEQ
jgi:hypothetical protein